MANNSTRGRGTGSGSPGRRSLAAAARAAAKRAEDNRPEAQEAPSGTQETLGQRPEDQVDDRTGLPPIEKAVGKVLRTDKAPAAPADVADEDIKLPGKADPEDPDPDDPDDLDAPDDPDDREDPDAEDRDPDAPPRGRERGRARLTAVLAVLTLLGLVAVGVLGWQYQEGRQVAQARTEALAAAKKAAPVVLSYDYRRLDKDFAAARGHLTGDFRDEYERTTKKVVAPTAKKYKGVVKGSVVAPPDGGAPAASVVSASPDSAVVLLFVNQVTKSTQVSDSRMDLNRVRMTLTRTSDGWKVSAVDAL